MTKLLRLAFLGILTIGCESSQGGSSGQASLPPAPPTAVPSAYGVSAGEALIGTWSGTLRETRYVDAFRISENVTVGQYRVCVEMGVCAEPEWREGACSGDDRRGVDAPTFAQPDADSAPITCAAPRQAEAFCGWATGGGGLPTSEQWLVAARGPDSVSRYAWGDEPISCGRHWRVRSGGSLSDCCGNDCSDPNASNPAASRGGLPDVFVARAELLAMAPDSVLPGCRRPDGYCAAIGVDLAAIDHFVPVFALERGVAATFRCVWPIEEANQ